MEGRGRRGRPSPRFEWDPANEEKLLVRHNVSALEAEECFANPNSARRARRDAFVLLGRTNHDRMLLIVYQSKGDGIVRIYSGREMTKGERRAYRRLMR
jgi:uncharacterized DUF497 family protein